MFKDLLELSPDQIFDLQIPTITSTGGMTTLYDFKVPNDGKIYVPVSLYIRAVTVATAGTRQIGYIFSGQGFNTRYQQRDVVGIGASVTVNYSWGLGTPGAFEGGFTSAGTASGSVKSGALPIMPLRYPDDFVLVCQGDMSGDQFQNIWIRFLVSPQSFREQRDNDHNPGNGRG